MPPSNTSEALAELARAVRSLAERLIITEAKADAVIRELDGVSARLDALRLDLAPVISEQARREAVAAARAELHAESAGAWSKLTAPIVAALESRWAPMIGLALLLSALRLLGVDPAPLLDTLQPSTIDRGASSSLATTPIQRRTS